MSRVNQRKKEHVRSVIFRSQHISRKDLLAVTGYNWRSVVRYAEELKAQGLIYETSGGEERRGRPTVVFHSNSEKVFFLGLTLVELRVTVLAMDINGFIFQAESLMLDKDSRTSMMLGQLQRMVDGICAVHKDMALMGLGFNCCLYHQNNRAMSAFRKFAHAAQESYYIPVIMVDNDSVLLYHLCRVNNLRGRIMGLVVGDGVHVSAVEHGVIIDMDYYVQRLRHWCIDSSCLEPCPCGKRGCLEAVLRDSARIARYWEKVGKRGDERVLTVKELYQLAEEGDETACEVLRGDALHLAQVCGRIIHDQLPDQFIFFSDSSLLCQEILSKYVQLFGAGGPPIQFCNCGIVEGMCEIVNMIRCHVLFPKQVPLES